MSGFYPTYPGAYDESAVEAICRELGVSALTARALIRRGIAAPEQARTFLHPLDEPLCDPLALPDMPEAVVRICHALAHDELICVYGDYDADGICASAILIRALELLGGRLLRYIPLRHSEGYGLNAQAVRKLAVARVRLLITVDNGVSAHDEIALCRNLGMDVIVTDHHSIGASLPECCAIVSGKRRDSAYPNPHLCGAGVALKLAQALLPESDHRFYLALAAVATVADVVPLSGENRAIVAQGLRHVPEVPGLRALLKTGGWKDGQPVSEQTAAFLIAPRLNASGRMGDAMRGVELLLGADEASVAALAQELDADNTARRGAESGIAEEALKQMDWKRRALLAWQEGWNPGVTGIVAARLCETYHRPVILFSEKDGVLTGSGRSPESVDLYAELSKLSRYFVRFGGHARAAGITLLQENFAPFSEAFLLAMDAYDESGFAPRFGYEEAVAIERLSVGQVCELGLLAPFGEGNPEPAFLFENVTLQNIAAMGKDGAHLSATAIQNGAGLRLVAFRRGGLAASLSEQNAYDVVARPAVNRFRDRETAELYLVAMEPADEAKKLFDAIFCKSVYNDCGMDAIIAEWYFSACGPDTPFCSKEALRGIYAVWQETLSKAPQSPYELAVSYPAKELIALLIFMQLSFFELDAAHDRVKPCAQVCASSLEKSALYRRLVQTGL